MVISWILGSVSELIKQSVMFVQDSAEIWRQLEQRYYVANSARKYQLSKAMYETKQQGRMIDEYYTELKCVWEEPEALRDLPALTALNAEVMRFVDAVRKDEEEQKLFQFLNGMDEVYTPQRSQLLMLTPLPSVDMAYRMLQQEETQKQILKPTEEIEVFDMLGKKDQGKFGDKWQKGKQKISANACNKSDGTGEISAHQLEQLLKLLPLPLKSGDEESEDEMEVNFAEVVKFNMVESATKKLDN
ncbi:uncharacterized protein LOC125495659 [Beta vulgaris subsp. vulgaris]|uniref:uncharacterized protein LOC125495659 n=1 Tax=Beta vulgaris subsp. vulgaris TaxID=3555 RepID=UPI0025483FC2|nr:uncharacterized protein LOC125495659 [Beta vulgaris subsp. vulgaris]